MKRAGPILLGILFGILCLLLATAVGLGLIHTTDWLYRIDLKALDIPAQSGVPAETALRNYKAVMRFLSPFVDEPFSLPDLAWSAEGAQHFVDCKVIFNAVYLMGAASLVGILLIMLAKRHRNKRFLKVGGITTLALPVVVLAAIAIDFNAAFILFHRIFFSNDLWTFNPATDPVIHILPADFFMHCGILIACCLILAGLLQLIFYGRWRKKSGGSA